MWTITIRTNGSWFAGFVYTVGTIHSPLPCCSCWTGNGPGSAKTRHHSAGGEAGGRHGVRPAWCEGQVDLSSHGSRGESPPSAWIDSRVCFVTVSDQPDLPEKRKHRNFLTSIFGCCEKLCMHLITRDILILYAKFHYIRLTTAEDGCV